MNKLNRPVQGLAEISLRVRNLDAIALILNKYPYIVQDRFDIGSPSIAESGVISHFYLPDHKLEVSKGNKHVEIAFVLGR